MNKRIYILIAGSILMSASCKKILQPETPSSFNQEFIFSTEVDARKAVNGVYALFNGDPFTSRVSTNYAGNTDVKAGGVAAGVDGGRRDIWSFEATSSNSELLAVWNNAYSAINKANECIEGINSSAIGKAAGMKQLAGGAKTLRALLTPNYYHSFDTTDLRLPVTYSIIAYDANLAQIPVAATSITMGKWNRLLRTGNLGASTSKGTGFNWPLMRYTDVLLMLAESENELNGPTLIAQNAIKIVRQRAFPASLWPSKVEAYLTTASASKDAFFTAVVNERAWEFGGEFLRKYDLARWNLFGKKVAETVSRLTQMGADANAGVGTYSNLADYLYYKKNADGTITFLNRYCRVATPPVLDATTIRVSWLRSLYNTTTIGPADYILRQYRGYNDPTGMKAVRYLLPLHSSVIANSLRTLDNSGYGFQ